MTTVTPLPTPVPSRQDPINFSTRADAFLGALPAFGTELNLVAGEVNTKASNAATSASTAITQAGIATTQAGIATTKANAATTARNEAVALTESYQGSLSADPTLDKNGNPLSAGDWYINSSTGFIRAYTGSNWVQGISAVSGVSSINGETGAVTNYVKTTGAQTLTNKTLEAAILNNGYTEEVFVVTGTTPALSPTNGSIQTWMLTGNSTPTQGTWASGQSITLMIDDSTAFTITWTSLGVVWKTNRGSAPTLQTTGVTVIQLWEVGNVIYGARVGDA